MIHQQLSFCPETPGAVGFRLFGAVPKLREGRQNRLLLVTYLVAMMFGLLGNRAANAQPVVNYPGGFAGSGGQIWLENGSKLAGTAIQLTAMTQGAANNIWYKTPVNVEAFSTTFTWTVICPAKPASCGDGMGFMIMSDPNSTPAGFTYSGFGGGQFSWSQCSGSRNTNCAGINSLLVKFDLYDNQSGSAGNLTGFYSGGEFPQAPNNPQYDMASSGINMQSGHLMRATLTYNGTALSELVTDTVTGATYTNSYAANVPSLVGGNTAYIGFGGGTGAATAAQNLQSWTYSVEASGGAAPPTFSPGGGTYSASQSVQLSSASSGTVICYGTTGSPATNGSNGCASGTLYTGPVAVSSSETLYAVAGGSGYGNSPVASASYVMQQSSGSGQAAAPIFSVAGGTYSASQSVRLSSASSGTVICYSTTGGPATNGSNGCASGTLYTGPLTVSSSETLYAVAGGAGYETSNVASASYVMQSPGSAQAVINYPSGFAAGCCGGGSDPIWLENSAALSGSTIQLVSLNVHSANNVWYKTPVNIQSFTTTFAWTVTCPSSGSGIACGDGFGFEIICACTSGNPVYIPPSHPGFTFSGFSGGQFSWSMCQAGGVNCPFYNSALIKFDLYNDETSSEGNLTGYYTNGEFPQAPNNPQYDMAPSGINMQSGHAMRATLAYNGTTLSETVTDTVTGATYRKSYPANIPAAIGANTAFVGFGGGTGAAQFQMNLKNWTYTAE